jgi:tetratricopeptide (TPR) repeat protein
VVEQRNPVGQDAPTSDSETRALVPPPGRQEPRALNTSPAPAEPQISPSIAEPRVQLGDFIVDQPLAAHYPIPSNISRLVIDADRDIVRGRLESALDLTLAAQCEQPDCLGLYVRQAELLLATGRHDAATRVVTSITSTEQALEGPPIEVEMERILTHANPTDANVLHLAHTLLTAGRTDLIDRYLPIAVQAASLQDDPGLAMDIARSWLEIRPDSLDAAFSMTRETIRIGQPVDDDIIPGSSTGAERDPRALIVRLVIHCASGDVEQWTDAAKLLSSIESKMFDAARVQSLLREMIAVQPSNESLLVHSGVLEINTGNPEAAHQLLSSVRPVDVSAYYVSTVASARAALASSDPSAAADALRRAIDLYEKPEIAEFAASCPLLRAPHDMFSVGKSVAGALQQRGDTTEGATLLERLASLNSGREDLSRAYADALAKSGKREIAVTRLEEMLRKHEEAGDAEGIRLTIQSILQIAPGNLRLRARLIDEYMKRGMLQEAVQERWAQAQILERAGRAEDALEQLRRASDVASMLGDWKKLEHIMRMMIRISPEDLDVRHAAATRFIEYGQIQLAIEQLWAAVEIGSRSDDPDESIAALHQIIALGPQQIDAYHKLGEVLASVGEYAQAERVYRRLSSLVPDDPAILAKQSALAAMANGSQ